MLHYLYNTGSPFFVLFFLNFINFWSWLLSVLFFCILTAGMAKRTAKKAGQNVIPGSTNGNCFSSFIINPKSFPLPWNLFFCDLLRNKMQRSQVHEAKLWNRIVGDLSNTISHTFGLCGVRTSELQQKWCLSNRLKDWTVLRIQNSDPHEWDDTVESASRISVAEGVIL